MPIPTKLMLHLTKSHSKFQSTGQNTYNAERKPMCLKHKVRSQNNKPKQEHLYGKMGKEHKLVNLPQNSNGQHITEK